MRILIKNIFLPGKTILIVLNLQERYSHLQGYIGKVNVQIYIIIV